MLCLKWKLLALQVLICTEHSRNVFCFVKEGSPVLYVRARTITALFRCVKEPSVPDHKRARVSITGIPPQGPITAPDARVSWCDAWLKANDREHFIFQSVLFLRSKCALWWLLFSSLQPIETAWRAERLENEDSSPFILSCIYSFIHSMNTWWYLLFGMLQIYLWTRQMNFQGDYMWGE